MIRNFLFLFVSSFFAVFTFAQITVNTTPTPAQLVNSLVGNGVTVSNITYQGQNSQRASFTAGNSNIGLPFGVVLTSGRAIDFVPPNQPNNMAGQFNAAGDADVLATAQSVTTNPDASFITDSYDAAVLEFDFVPSGNQVSFRFVFASEEYTTYINTSYNDAFGFYITGPNPGGGTYSNQNMAVVPGTNQPITISTIYPSLPGQPGLNSQYYLGNPSGHTFNGFTVPLTIDFPVVCGETYHFKFAIADCSDDYLDTGVFLEGASFSSNGLSVDISTVNGDSTIFEGCSPADIIFVRPSSDIADSLVINYNLFGTAQLGYDYDTLQNPIIFAPGQDTVILVLNAINDGILEPLENVIIEAFIINECGDTVNFYGELWINNEPNLSILESDTLLRCKQDSITITAMPSGGMMPYILTWAPNGTLMQHYNFASTAVPADSNGVFNYVISVQDMCSNYLTDTITVVINQTLQVDTVYSLPATCEPVGSVYGFASGQTGIPYYHWNGPGSTNPTGIDASVWTDLSPGWYYFTVTDDVCEVLDSVLVDMTDPPQAQLQADPPAGCAPFSVNFINTSQNASFYKWDFGNGQTLETNSTASQTQTYTETTLIELIAFEGTCSDTTTVVVVKANCGCMDPNALNYDPTAQFSDGSCIFPDPEVETHNVFTPNGDGDNDIFFLTPKYTESVELFILNRWGTVVFKNKGVNPTWNGKSDDGKPLADGVYFYRYIATGLQGQLVEGSGFLQLIR